VGDNEPTTGMKSRDCFRFRGRRSHGRERVRAWS
jgi:hypothetical protein